MLVLIAENVYIMKGAHPSGVSCRGKHCSKHNSCEDWVDLGEG